jgi:hypothetical protein
MKSLFFLVSMTLLSVSAQACPNLSGLYRFKEVKDAIKGQVSIKQDSCKSVSVQRSFFSGDGFVVEVLPVFYTDDYAYKTHPYSFGDYQLNELGNRIPATDSDENFCEAQYVEGMVEFVCYKGALKKCQGKYKLWSSDSMAKNECTYASISIGKKDFGGPILWEEHIGEWIEKNSATSWALEDIGLYRK